MKSAIDYTILCRLGERLQERSYKIFLAESMTAGLLGTIMSLEVHAGDYLLGSINCFDRTIKQDILFVKPSLIDSCCAESKEVTRAMLAGLKKIQQADIYVSITGLAYKSNNPKQQRPIGTVYVMIDCLGETRLYDLFFEGNASEIMIQTCNRVYRELLHVIR